MYEYCNFEQIYITFTKISIQAVLHSKYIFTLFLVTTQVNLLCAHVHTAYIVANFAFQGYHS